jgi:hypothetical protein
MNQFWVEHDIDGLCSAKSRQLALNPKFRLKEKLVIE